VKLNRPARIATLSHLLPITRDWFIDAMREKGWLEERDFILVQSDYPDGDPNLDEAAARTVGSKPDLIFVTSLHYALAAHRITGDRIAQSCTRICCRRSGLKDPKETLAPSGVYNAAMARRRMGVVCTLLGPSLSGRWRSALSPALNRPASNVTGATLLARS
jgi:hypothetical protein